METKLQKVADELVSKLENFAKENQMTDAYQFEKGIANILTEGNKQFMQAVVGESQGENSKVKVKTTFGEIIVPKKHPMSNRPMGFGISPCLQEQWNYIEERYPNSIQILDFFHCKEHICRFSKEFFANTRQAASFSEELCNMLLEEKVDQAIETIRELEIQTGKKHDEKEKLTGYLETNKKRINYGRFKKMGLHIGSGAIESAQH